MNDTVQNSCLTPSILSTPQKDDALNSTAYFKDIMVGHLGWMRYLKLKTDNFRRDIPESIVTKHCQHQWLQEKVDHGITDGVKAKRARMASTKELHEAISDISEVLSPTKIEEGVPQESPNLCSNIAEKSNDPVSVSSLADDDANLATRAYNGSPSTPTSDFRTGVSWQKSAGFEAHPVPKIIGTVFDDKLAAVWKDMGTQVYKCLDSFAVKWTTIDVVCFNEPDTDGRIIIGPIVLWIGVHPSSLPPELAQEAIRACKDILLSFDFGGVEIAFRESVFKRYRRTPSDHVPSDSPIACFCDPLTASLGLPIASVQTSEYEGTGGLYLSVGSSMCLLTVRHVVLPFPEILGDVYDDRRSSGDPVQVMLFGPEALNNRIQPIDEKMAALNEKLGDGNTDEVEKERMKKDVEELENLKDDWSNEEDRIIGRVLYAPPNMPVGPNFYAEDWALVELVRNKFNCANFRGNVIDLGTEIPVEEFSKMMPSTFEYPSDGLFPIQGIVPEDELWASSMMLIKNGFGTNTTIGCSNGIKSFVREYAESNGTSIPTMELAILGHSSAAFSSFGDSGAIIVDSNGRAAALLNGGAMSKEYPYPDITYGTPFEWLFERIKTIFPDVQLYSTT
ncbi:hypothetical protein BDQ17DRAFT_1312800 [Cyathus striatus]|nr:hypothetical protein BDQ17DRAFT_1312800 [Cyathus striatus]